jgi:hypothetical protein
MRKYPALMPSWNRVPRVLVQYASRVTHLAHSLPLKPGSQAVTNSMPKRRASWKWRLKWHWSLLDLLIEPTLRMKSNSFLYARP